MGCKLGALAQQGGIDVLNAPAMLLEDLRHAAGQLQAVGTGVLRVIVREMLADIPQRRCTQHGIHHRMGQHVCIRMPQQAFFKGDLHPAKDQLALLYQTMYIIAVSNTHFRFLPLCRAGQILPGGDLQVCIVALRQLHRASGQFKQAAIIGNKAGAGLVQFFQRRKVRCTVKALGGLHRIQGAAVRGSVHRAVRGHGFAIAPGGGLDGILHRHRRGCCAAPGGSFQRRCNDRRTHKGAGGIVHRHQFSVRCQHAVFCALGAGSPARYDLHRLWAVRRLLRHKLPVFACHQHNLGDLRTLSKGTDTAVQHRFTSQIKAELIKTHAGRAARRHQYCRYSFFHLFHLPCRCAALHAHSCL